MKKLIAILLSLVMICSLATAAFADDLPLDEDTSFTKNYDVKGGEAPAETFDFNIEFENYVSHEGDTETSAPENAPVVTLGDAAFAADLAQTGTANVDVTITGVTASSPLGVYTYKITEVPSNTAGVNYVAKVVYLNVTILRDETNGRHYVAAIHYEGEDGLKTGVVTNEYEAGQLTISKTITGNMAEMGETFPFEVIFTPENSDYLTEGDTPVVTVFKDNQVVSDNTVTRTVNQDGTITVTFNLGHNGNVVITNIPDSTTYVVKETDLKGYEQTSATGEVGGDAVDVIKPVSGTINNGDADTAAFTNDRTEGVDTGIALDSAPYILMLVVAMVGMVALVSKKRYEV